MVAIDIYEMLNKFEELPEKIYKCEAADAFQESWRRVFSSGRAKDKTEVVYIWRAANPIPRLKGASDIIYIGKTKNTIYSRHYGYAEKEANEYNKARYDYILEHYGTISIYVCHFSEFGKDLTAAEQNLLDSYFNHHLEYPPLNRMGK